MKTKFFIPIIILLLFCACKGKNGYEVVNNSSSDADTAKDQVSSDVPKLVKTASMSFKVKSVNQTATRIDALASGFGGMVMHQQIGSGSERSQDVPVSSDSVMRVTSLSTTAEMTVKVPSEKMAGFLDSVASMGMYLTNRSLDITDKTLDYLSARLKLKSRAELVAQQKTGKIVIKDPAKVLDLKDDMIDQQIDNRHIDDAVRNSVVNLSFYQSNTINKEVIVNDDPSAYNLPFFSRLGNALKNGWAILVDIVVALANLWAVLLMVGLVWAGMRYYIKKKKVVEVVKG